MFGFCHFGNWGSLGYLSGGSFGMLSGWSWAGLVVNLVFWVVLLVGLAILVVRSLGRAPAHAVAVPYASGQPTAREILQARYARGEITREQFEGLIDPILQRTVGPVKQAIRDAALTPEQINEVALVGGSTRIPRVHQMVRELFKREPHSELNPDEVVALGAAVQANILGGGSEATKDMLLLDVTPLSLGIEALGGVVAKIIHRNSTIPASATEHFTTGVEGQANVAIHVLQGERELAKDNRSLARFDLKGIPPMPAGLPRIEVRFLIDANGILHVSAREQRSGKEAEIKVQPSYGLTDDQVETMILESFDYAEQDFAQRCLRRESRRLNRGDLRPGEQAIDIRRRHVRPEGRIPSLRPSRCRSIFARAFRITSQC